MAKPCCSQIDVVTGGTDWKANVQIEGRHETLHPADEIRTSTNNRCFTHSIHFGRCRAGGAACAGHDGCAHRASAGGSTGCAGRDRIISFEDHRNRQTSGAAIH